MRRVALRLALVAGSVLVLRAAPTPRASPPELAPHEPAPAALDPLRRARAARAQARSWLHAGAPSRARHRLEQLVADPATPRRQREYASLELASAWQRAGLDTLAMQRWLELAARAARPTTRRRAASRARTHASRMRWGAGSSRALHTRLAIALRDVDSTTTHARETYARLQNLGPNVRVVVPSDLLVR